MLRIVAVQSTVRGVGSILLTNSSTCPCCSVRLRTKPKKRKND